jgi:hypothetical protein
VIGGVVESVIISVGGGWDGMAVPVDVVEDEVDDDGDEDDSTMLPQAFNALRGSE